MSNSKSDGVSMEIGDFLSHMKWVVSGVGIQDDLATASSNGFDAFPDQKRFDLIRAGEDSLVAAVAA